MVYKTSEIKLLASFAEIISTKKDGKKFTKALAYAIAHIQPHINLNYPKSIKFDKISKIIDLFYDKSSNPNVLSIPKDKFKIRFFRRLLKKGILVKINKKNFQNSSHKDIFIIFLSKEILLLNKKDVRKII
jgi:hypothetical protein